ncbi:ChbG/HpnK family deacetylase [bacterium]|nr:ChbG/HpnK family deacetylase [bacterium]
MKKFILNADDFGMSKAYNRAVLEGYESGILKSTSLTANGEAFEEACEKVIPACPDLGVGIHLNIIEGKSLCPDLDQLTDNQGNFNNSFGALLLKSLNPNNKAFMEQIEKEVSVSFWERYDEDHTVVRFATSWATREADLEHLWEILDRIEAEREK